MSPLLPTKLALVATLVAVTAAVGDCLRRAPESLGDPRLAGAYLVLFTALFLLRVAGQLAVVSLRPAWLPPAAQWNFVPYPILLPMQIAFLAVMLAIDVDLARGTGVFARPTPTVGAVLVPLSYVYWSAMAGRYALRMTRRPDQRWFGGAIPIVFHCVLAAFLFVYGSYHASA